MKSIGSGLQEVVGFGTSSSHDDQPLVGFEELATPLPGSFDNFARWIAHDSDEAEDLVQETYLKALRGFASFQPGTNFRSWMSRILRNNFLSSRSQFERRMTDARDSEENRAPNRRLRNLATVCSWPRNPDDEMESIH
jgi:RNA polymerase sigma factor (sigma-70 family)